MPTQILQRPLFSPAPVGQDLMFVMYNDELWNLFNGLNPVISNLKYIAEVYISSGEVPNPSNNSNLVGTFKTVPNVEGVGMFDISPIVENFVSADNLATSSSRYKNGLVQKNLPVPIHLIDKFSGAKNTAVYVVVVARTTYLGSDGNIYITPQVNSELFTLFNGYLKQTNPLIFEETNYGFNISNFTMDDASAHFFSNAPDVQNANINDYGTLPILKGDKIQKVDLTYLTVTGAVLDEESVPYDILNGGFAQNNGTVQSKILFFGCFPGNLQNWSDKFKALVAAGTIEGGFIKISVRGTAFGNPGLSKTYRINVNCPKLKGYKPIRLTWLNQWGTWDYYTFNMKSTKTFSTKGSTYQQLEGTWNERTHKIYGHNGGKKAFRVNTTEKITMNTDFVSEEESEWFEDLINSPEVYILTEYKEIELAQPSFNTYVLPVRLTTTSYTKKTVANDKLMQYTFEVEKTKTLRTQSV